MSEWVYGIHAVSAVLSQQPVRARRLYLQQGRRDRRLNELQHLADSAGVPWEEKPRDQLDDMVEGRHQGAVLSASAAGSVDEHGLPALLDALNEAPFLLVLDGVTDPHNLGACLRSAEAAGVDAVIVPRDRAAGLNATVRKVACGAAEVLPLVQVTNLARTLRMLKERGIWLVGAAGEAEQLLYDIDLAGPLALVLGAEGKGLRRLTREHCDHLARLPMAGTVSSLNVSVAAGVCLFEAVRQRGVRGS